MQHLILFLLCLVAGVCLRRSGRAAADAHRALSSVIVHVSLPAMALNGLHQVRWDAAMVSGALMPWALFLIGVLCFVPICRWMAWPRETLGVLILMGGLSNTSFVGLPLVQAFYGGAAVPTAMAIDQVGTYLVLSTLGIAVAAYCGKGSASLGSVGVRIATYPPFLAMAAALLLAPWPYPDPVVLVLVRLSDTVAPLALIAVGMQVSSTGLRRLLAPLTMGLAFKLVVCPALVFAAYALSGRHLGRSESVVVLESAMGPAIGAGIVAAQHELNPRLVNLFIGIGIPLSLLSVPMLQLFVLA
jgi:predicted permease